MAEQRVAHERLKALVIHRLQGVGVQEKHAEVVADVLVHADLRGVSSHGVLRTEHYCKRFRSGGFNPDPRFSLEKTGPSSAIFDGDDGIGHVVAKEAMEAAIGIAEQSGIGMVGVKNSSHCGALSYFVQQAAEQQMIGIAMTHTDQAVVPFGGARSFFGTNPLAFGVPAFRHPPIILDMATSQAALGKVLHAREQGERIPSDWGVDRQGRPVTDPHRVSALLPFAGPKGYGLAMMVDILSGILTGSTFGPHITAMYGDYEEKRKLGHFFCVIDPAIFTEKGAFRQQVDHMIDEIHQTLPAEGVEQVLVPGEPEQLKQRVRLKEGIPVPNSVFQFLNHSDPIL